MAEPAQNERKEKVPPSEAEVAYLREKWKFYSRTIESICKWGVLLVLGLCTTEPLQHIAKAAVVGTSALSLLLAAFAGAFAVLALVSIIWALRERRLRQEKTEYLTNRIRTLESYIDPQRTSSNLATTGKTHPEDE